MARKPKVIIGWEEWCALPELGLPAIKAKIDTGAKTSALHAYDIKRFRENDLECVRFKIHPLQHDHVFALTCVAPLVDHRHVISSNGEREKRYVIAARLVFPNVSIKAELTLTSRHNMAFRMLLGREALRKAKFAVDPAKSFLLGRQKNVEKLYQEPQT
ncbi:MAG: ATP-dependent zinc protease [Alphaproteobacteria bacterium]|nr:ATP-dependent zinc protease [Alphaproteobacteria bacterium]